MLRHGQPQAIDRFRYGIDDWIIGDMLGRRGQLYQQAHHHILNELRDQGVAIPAGTQIPIPQLNDFDVFGLVSEYSFGTNIPDTIENIKTGMLQRFETMQRFFSLQVAVDYCTFLASCSFAVNNFTYKIPGVGSEMRVATITQGHGFEFKKIWEVTPSDIRIP